MKKKEINDPLQDEKQINKYYYKKNEGFMN